MLRVAYVGYDDGLLQLLTAAQRREDVSIVAGYQVDEKSSDKLRRISPLPRSADGENWECLLSGTVADAVFFGRVPENDDSNGLAKGRFGDRDEMLRRLVQAEVPLVVTHPPCEMLLAYELQMIRQESHAPVFPYVPWIQHSAVNQAIKAVSQASNDVQQLVLQRYADASARSEEQVLRQVAQDVLVLRRMMGDVKSVSATAGAIDRNPYGNLAVHLMGEDNAGLVARWSMGPISARPQSVWQPRELSDPSARVELSARLTLVADEHSGSLDLFADNQSARFQPPAPQASAVEATESLADQFVNDVVACVRDGQVWSGITWEEACRSLEITDAIQRSLQRRRTIELYHEQVTEHDTFKSVMAAGGCGMLLWVMLLLMIAGVVEGLQLPIRGTLLWRLWPFALIAPLAVFLGLQLLQLVFKRSDASAANDTA